MNFVSKETGLSLGSQDAIVVNGTTLTRASFGSSRLGETAWVLIQSGATCEAIIEGRPCGKPGIGTTDYDVKGEAELKVHCSEDHNRVIIEGVSKDLSAIGRSTAFGRNGFGRERATA